jgi:hypothetical protein
MKKKFNAFSKNQLSQSNLRQMYGGGKSTQESGNGSAPCSDFIDNCGKTTNSDGTYYEKDYTKVGNSNDSSINLDGRS